MGTYITTVFNLLLFLKRKSWKESWEEENEDWWGGGDAGWHREGYVFSSTFLK